MKRGVIVLIGFVIIGGISFEIIKNVKRKRDNERTERLIHEAEESIERAKIQLVEIQRVKWNINKEIHETEKVIKKTFGK